jgi:hypothetical protein
MSKEFEERVRKRAYEIWECEGRSGDPHEHWARAEQELAGMVIDGGKNSSGHAAEDKFTDKLGDFA